MVVQTAKREKTVEERVTRLESHVEHIQADIAEIKIDVRRLDETIDGRFNSLKDSVADLRLSMERSFTRITLWGLTLYFALAASLLGVMAKGFGWIH